MMNGIFRRMRAKSHPSASQTRVGAQPVYASLAEVAHSSVSRLLPLVALVPAVAMLSVGSLLPVNSLPWTASAAPVTITPPAGSSAAESVSTWADLITAIGDANSGKIDTIELSGNLTGYTGQTIPVITAPKLTIDGSGTGTSAPFSGSCAGSRAGGAGSGQDQTGTCGYTLDFRNGTTDYSNVAQSFRLNNSSTINFTLKNVNVVRPNSQNPLITNSSFGNSDNDDSDNTATLGGTNTYAKNFTINVANLSTNDENNGYSFIAPGGSLVVAYAATLNLSGLINWDNSKVASFGFPAVNFSAAVLNAAVITISGAATPSSTSLATTSSAGAVTNTVPTCSGTSLNTDVLLRNNNGTGGDYGGDYFQTIAQGVTGMTNSFTVCGGAQVYAENMSTVTSSSQKSVPAALMQDANSDSSTSTPLWINASGAGTKVFMASHCAASDALAGTVGQWSGAGGVNIIGGATFAAHSYVSSNNTNATAAMSSEVNGGTFTVDGEGSQLNLVSDGEASGVGGVGAALRFRIVGNQTLNAQNLGQIHITKSYRKDASTKAAGIRFGLGSGNNFNVNSGGLVWVENQGDSGGPTSCDSSGNTPSCNNGIEYDAANFGFTVTGSATWSTAGTDSSGAYHAAGQLQPSGVYIASADGPAISASGESGGNITIGKGTVFIAHGNVNAAALGGTQGIISAGSNFSFTATQPLYYDFANYRNNGTDGTMKGGYVFDTSSSSFALTDSDMSVWRNGRSLTSNSTSGGSGADVSTTGVVDTTGAKAADWPTPYKAWSRLSLSLSGTNFGTIGSTSDSSLTTAGTSFGSQGFRSYTRISGNNAYARITDMGQTTLTNADKYLRATTLVPEGFNFGGRPVWDGETMAYVQQKTASGTTTSTLLADTSCQHFEGAANDSGTGCGGVNGSPAGDNWWTEQTAPGKDSPAMVPSPLTGVTRFAIGTTSSTAGTGTPAFATTGDNYCFTDVWRGPSTDPNSNLNHHLTDSAGNPTPDIEGQALCSSGGQTVVDATPPTPATIDSIGGGGNHGNLYASQDTLAGTIPAEPAYNAQVPTAIKVVVMRAGKQVYASTDTGSPLQVTWNAPSGTTAGSYTVSGIASLPLQANDQIYVELSDGNAYNPWNPTSPTTGTDPVTGKPYTGLAYHDAVLPLAPFVSYKSAPAFSQQVYQSNCQTLTSNRTISSITPTCLKYSNQAVMPLTNDYTSITIHDFLDTGNIKAGVKPGGFYSNNGDLSPVNQTLCDGTNDSTCGIDLYYYSGSTKVQIPAANVSLTYGTYANPYSSVSANVQNVLSATITDTSLLKSLQGATIYMDVTAKITVPTDGTTLNNSLTTTGTLDVVSPTSGNTQTGILNNMQDPLVEVAGNITGTLFTDKNGDGNWNGVSGGDSPLAGQTVSLLNADGSPALNSAGSAITTTTGADGTYSFSGLDPSSQNDSTGKAPVPLVSIGNKYEIGFPAAASVNSSDTGYTKQLATSSNQMNSAVTSNPNPIVASSATYPSGTAWTAYPTTAGISPQISILNPVSGPGLRFVANAGLVLGSVLTVDNQITGSMADKSQAMTYTLTLLDNSGAPVPDNTVVGYLDAADGGSPITVSGGKGQASFSLVDGGLATIDRLATAPTAADISAAASVVAAAAPISAVSADVSATAADAAAATPNGLSVGYTVSAVEAVSSAMSGYEVTYDDSQTGQATCVAATSVPDSLACGTAVGVTNSVMTDTSRTISFVNNLDNAPLTGFSAPAPATAGLAWVIGGAAVGLGLYLAVNAFWRRRLRWDRLGVD